MIIGRSLAAHLPAAPGSRRRPGRAVLEARGIATDGRARGTRASSCSRARSWASPACRAWASCELFLACFGMATLRPGRDPGRWPAGDAGLAARRDPRATSASAWCRRTARPRRLFLKLDGRSNVSLPVIDRFARAGLIDTRAETAAVARVLRPGRGRRRARSTRRSARSPAATSRRSPSPSGCWRESRILLMFDPTRGVDVGTKHELYLLMRAYRGRRRRRSSSTRPRSPSW